ncbi:MAG: hypothetical protein HWD82_06315 [Flavobacteriaceae bacterium]|nr:hypothetical protein [Flavobacteriaceae bacterium]
MIKALLSYTLIFFGLYLVGLGIHEYYLSEKDLILPFSINKVYQFHFGFSLLVCVNLKLLSNVNKFLSQLGFIYLGTLLVKILLFAIVFYQSVFAVESLSQTSRLSLLIPALIFLLTEAVFVVKILNENNS